MITYEDWGTLPYSEALARQQALVSAALEARKRGTEPEEKIIFVQHPAVITLGRHAKRTNLLVDEATLRRRGIDLVQIDRGGDITLHSPGQIVVYYIVDLIGRNIGVKAFMHSLEETVIRTLADLGIEGGRVEGATGVWLGIGTPRERKICAMGVSVHHGVTMHGLALNVSNDLSLFSQINPCGFTDKGVTSIATELNHPVSPDDIQPILRRHLHPARQ